MYSFTCHRCANLVYFDNIVCLRCGAELGYDPHEHEMTGPDDGLDRCANFEIASCNWLVRDDGGDVGEGRCLSCQLTRTRPADDDVEALARFAETETQKRWLVHQLIDLGLPVEPFRAATGEGLAFDLLSSRYDRVTIGHDDGLITIDLAESNDAHRETVRAELGEAYRTVLGHLRHEVGHYYWDVLIDIDDIGRTDFRRVFGDERHDYGDALNAHYENGPPGGWVDNYVSQYATMHPWEDWAETFAHYLHIRDGLQTADSFGLVASARAERGRSTNRHGDSYRNGSIDDLIARWLDLTLPLNAMSRSLGHRELYPFVLSPGVMTKLAFVHDRVRAAANDKVRQRVSS